MSAAIAALIISLTTAISAIIAALTSFLATRFNLQSLEREDTRNSHDLRMRGHGLPIYLDATGRQLADPAADSELKPDWRPTNNAAAKLWRCIEVLRDIKEILAAAASSTDGRTRRRRLKSLAVPLISLANETRRLCRHFATDPQWKHRIARDMRDRLTTLNDDLKRIYDGCSILELRDKYAAHMDEGMLPNKARLLLSGMAMSDYGRCLHSCLWVLFELLDLKLYTWSAADAADGYFRTMNQEPFMLTWLRDQEGNLTLAGAHIAQTPLQAAEQLCEDLVVSSQWLFAEGEARLMVVDRGEPEHLARR